MKIWDSVYIFTHTHRGEGVQTDRDRERVAIAIAIVQKYEWAAGIYTSAFILWQLAAV